MKPLRPHVAISIDGGGIRGAMVARALAILEEHLGQSAHDTFRLAAGTSTGAVLSTGIAVGMTGAQMHHLYSELGDTVFRKSWRSLAWPLTRYRYSLGPLERSLRVYLGDRTMGDLWTADPPTDLVITVFDLVHNRTRFVKPWKPEYATLPIVTAVLASSAVPTYFPVVEGRYVDGGIGSYANPCYVAAYELSLCLGWDPRETTLISLGTGRDPNTLLPWQANRYMVWDWVDPLVGAFLSSADDQQVHLVRTFFQELDFRRFQVDLREPIDMDDPRAIARLTAYGDELGLKIINDELDRALQISAGRPASND